jgi:hypothetical protein
MWSFVKRNVKKAEEALNETANTAYNAGNRKANSAFAFLDEKTDQFKEAASEIMSIKALDTKRRPTHNKRFYAALIHIRGIAAALPNSEKVIPICRGMMDIAGNRNADLCEAFVDSVNIRWGEVPGEGGVCTALSNSC